MAGHLVDEVVAGGTDGERAGGTGLELRVAGVADHGVGETLAFGLVGEFEQLGLAVGLQDDLLLAAALPLVFRLSVGVLDGHEGGVGDLRGEFPLAHPQVGPGDDGLFHTPIGGRREIGFLIDGGTSAVETGL